MQACSVSVVLRLLLKSTLLSVLVCGSLAGAHEVRPALLQITQSSDRSYQVLWKRPLMGEMAVHLVPHLSSGWLEVEPTAREVMADFSIATWHIEPGTEPHSRARRSQSRGCRAQSPMRS
jgi:hypothetical protein